jgi:cysteine synthase
MTNEQLAYEHAKAVGWNEAVKAAARIAREHSRWIGSSNYANRIDCQDIASKIEKLDKSMQATDD